MPAHLTLRFSDRPAYRYTLDDGGDYLAGRSDECPLKVDDSRVSRRHARFVQEDGRWWVTDLGSKNGVRVEGREVEGSAALPDACWMSLGGLVARFERLSEEEARARSERDRVRWQTSLKLPDQLDPEAGLERLLAQLLDSVLRLSGAERAFVVLARPGAEPGAGNGGSGASGDLEVAATAGVAAEELGRADFAGSVGAVQHALASGIPVVTTDAQDDALLGSRPSVALGGIRALVCVPLDVPGRGTGAVYADSRTPGSAFTQLDVEILQALTSHAALALAVAGISREVEGIAGEMPTPARGEAGQTAEEPSSVVSWKRLVADHGL
jgi:hypothetical protein